jgi:bifunctional non-homologous end joining protein LigD
MDMKPDALGRYCAAPDLRDEPLEQRRARLKRLLKQSKGTLLRYSDSFPDAVVLLAECIRLGLEGIVCKRKDAPYRSGSRSGWIIVKTEEWKAANQYRAKLFAIPQEDRGGRGGRARGVRQNRR